MTKTEELRRNLDTIYSILSNLDVHNGAVKLTDKGWRAVRTALKEAGLAFVVKDAELPKTAYRALYEYRETLKHLKKAGWEKTEEIELT